MPCLPMRRRRKIERPNSRVPPAYSVFTSKSSPCRLAPILGKRRNTSSRCFLERRYFFSISSPIKTIQRYLTANQERSPTRHEVCKARISGASSLRGESDAAHQVLEAWV